MSDYDSFLIRRGDWTSTGEKEYTWLSVSFRNGTKMKLQLMDTSSCNRSRASSQSGRGVSGRDRGAQPVGLCHRASACEAAHSASVPGRHQVVEQRVDGSAEVEEDGGHEVEILRQVVVKKGVLVRVRVRVTHV